MFTLKTNLGIAGGREHAALYIAGISGDELIYLDPHFVKKAVPSNQFKNIDKTVIKQYHCKTMKKMKISKMCTSVALGFYIRGPDEYEEFKLKIIAMSKLEDSIFSVFKKEEELKGKLRDIDIDNEVALIDFD